MDERLPSAETLWHGELQGDMVISKMETTTRHSAPLKNKLKYLIINLLGYTIVGVEKVAT